MARFEARLLPGLKFHHRPKTGSRFPHQLIRRPRRCDQKVTWLVQPSLAQRIREQASPQLAECCLHLLTTLATKSIRHKDPDHFFPLHSELLRGIYTSRYHGATMSLLRKLGAIELRRDGSYEPGVACKKYRLAAAFRDIEAIPSVSHSLAARSNLIYTRSAFRKYQRPEHRWVMKCFYRATLHPGLDAVLSRHDFPSPLSRIASLHNIDVVREHRLEVVVDEKTGRMYYPIANLPKIARRHLLLEGEPTVEVDIAACQPTLLAMLYPDRRNGEFNRYLELVQSERFYETIAEWAGLGWTRGEAKEAFFSQIAYSYAAVWTKLPLYPHFAARFPELMQHIARLKCRHKAYLPLEMQSLEADIMIRGVCAECADRKIPVLPVHDSIICAREQAAAVKELVLTHWHQVTHLPCHVRIQ